MWVLWSGIFAAKGRWWDFIYLVTTVGVLPELCSPSIRQIKLPFEVRRCHYYPPKSIAHIQYSWPKGTNPVFSGSLGQRRAWEGITQQQTSDLFCKLLFADLCPRYIPQSQAQTGWQPGVNLVLLLDTLISRDLKEVCSDFLWVISTWASVTLWGSSESQGHKIASCHCLKNPCNQQPFPRLHSGKRL